MARLTYVLYFLMAATLQQEASGSGLDCTGFGPLKVVFVLDGSGSLKKGSFEHQWKTAKKLFKGFVNAYGKKYAAENFHVGIVQFNVRAYVERNIRLGLDAFDHMPAWRRGGTRFKPAIDKAASMINSYTPAGTEKAHKLIVFLADGGPNLDCGHSKFGTPPPTQPEDCKPKDIDILAVFIPTSPPAGEKDPDKPLDIMRRLTPCTGLVKGTGKGSAEGAYGLDESGQRCPYLIVSGGPHRYKEVQERAKTFAQAVMDKIETPFYCKANEHVLRHTCVSCPGRPAGDNACAGDTLCASHEKPGTGSGGDKKPGGGSGGNKNPSGGSEGGNQPGYGSEGGNQPGGGSEGSKQPGGGNEGSKQPGYGSEGGEQPGYGSEGSKQPGDGSEGGRQPGYGSEGSKQPGYGSEGGEQPGYGNEGGEQPYYGSEGGEQPGYGSESGKRLAGGTSGGNTVDGSDDYDSEGAKAASNISENESRSIDFSDILAIVLPIIAVLCVAFCFAFYKTRKSKRRRDHFEEGFMPGRFSTSHRSTRSSQTSRSTHQNTNRSGLQSSLRHGKTTTARKKRAKSSHSDRTKSSRVVAGTRTFSTTYISCNLLSLKDVLRTGRTSTANMLFCFLLFSRRKKRPQQKKWEPPPFGRYLESFSSCNAFTMSKKIF